MVTLNESVRMITLQFGFSNPRVLPPHVQMRMGNKKERGVRMKGEVVLESEDRCSLLEFLRELRSLGFELVDSFYEERPAPRGDCFKNRRFVAVRFNFCSREFAKPSAFLQGQRDEILADLEEMCRAALWQVRVFDNPFFDDGVRTDHRFISVNLTSRRPLSQVKGGVNHLQIASGKFMLVLDRG